MGLPYTTTSFPYGSRVLSVNGTAYIAENFDITGDTDEIARQTELGAPNGFALVKNPRKGTAVLQLATTSTSYVSEGDAFSTTHRGTSVTFIITSASDPESSKSAKTQNVSFRENI